MRKNWKLWKTIKEEIIDTENRFLAAAWVSAIVGILLMGIYLNTELPSFLGVAESREMQISFEYPVEVKNIHILSGQTVKKGDLLIELNQTGINDRLRVLQAEIAKIEAELKVRKQLFNIMKRKHQKVTTVDPLEVDLLTRKKDVVYLENQKKNLFVFSEFDGVVGSVNFKRGEKVPAFTPVISISAIHPNYIHGFVHENLHARLQVGQDLEISSAVGGPSVSGKIVSIGSRITPIPERLLKVTGLVSWGREVVVEIPEKNQFLLGEKVKLQTHWNLVGFSSASAGDSLSRPKDVLKPSETNKKTNGDNDGLETIRVPDNISEEVKFEPSGLIYLSDLKKYLVVNDESESLFLIDSKGQVDDQFLRIRGLKKVDDLESISQDQSSIYILSSQTRGKSDKKSRQVFAQLARHGLNFELVASAELRPALLRACAHSDSKLLKGLAETVDSDKKKDDLNIESHFVIGDDLYVGLKGPVLADNQIVILKIERFKTLFEHKRLSSSQLSVWKTIDLPESLTRSRDYVISDMIMVENRWLYFSTSCLKFSCSALWRLDLNASRKTPELVRSFKEAKLEGLAFDKETNTMMGVFDQDGREAYFVRF